VVLVPRHPLFAGHVVWLAERLGVAEGADATAILYDKAGNLVQDQQFKSL